VRGCLKILLCVFGKAKSYTHTRLQNVHSNHTNSCRGAVVGDDIIFQTSWEVSKLTKSAKVEKLDDDRVVFWLVRVLPGDDKTKDQKYKFKRDHYPQQDSQRKIDGNNGREKQ
jgi:hypothetical protein